MTFAYFSMKKSRASAANRTGRHPPAHFIRHLPLHKGGFRRAGPRKPGLAAFRFPFPVKGIPNVHALFACVPAAFGI